SRSDRRALSARRTKVSGTKKCREHQGQARPPRRDRLSWPPPSIGVRGKQAIVPRLETNRLADADSVVTGRLHFDDVLAVASAQRDFEAPCRSETVHPLDDAAQHGVAGIR